MIREWQEFLVKNAPRWGLPCTSGWNFVFHNNYHPHCSNINLLWFHGRNKFPEVVTKLYRDKSILTREFDNLTHVYRCLPGLAPRPFHSGLQASFWALWMEGLPGSRYTESGTHAPQRLASIAEMIGTMHATLRKEFEKPTPGRHARVVTEPLAALADFLDSGSVREGCATLRAKASGEWLASISSIPQHGDLFSGNILLHRNQWHVIDWESFGSIDLPFYDLLTFLISLLSAGGNVPQRWDRALVAQVPDLVDRYSRAAGVSSGDISLLLPLTLSNWFYLQLRDGRQEFTRQMYQTIESYFADPAAWQNVFVGAKN